MLRGSETEESDDFNRLTMIISRGEQGIGYSFPSYMTTRGGRAHCSFCDDPRAGWPKAITPHWGHGVHSRDPINCVFACIGAQAHLMAGRVHGGCMANGRPWGWLFGLLSVPRSWRWNILAVGSYWGGGRKAMA